MGSSSEVTLVNSPFRGDAARAFFHLASISFLFSGLVLQLYSLSPLLKLSDPHGGAHAYKSKCCLEYFNLITQEVISYIQGSTVC